MFHPTLFVFLDVGCGIIRSVSARLSLSRLETRQSPLMFSAVNGDYLARQYLLNLEQKARNLINIVEYHSIFMYINVDISLFYGEE